MIKIDERAEQELIKKLATAYRKESLGISEEPNYNASDRIEKEFDKVFGKRSREMQTKAFNISLKNRGK